MGRGDGGEFPGELEQMLMLAALRLGEDAYGSAMTGLLEERVDRRVSRGSIYVTLDRLEAKGWIRSRMSEPRAERGGRRRRLIEVTPEGRARLQRSRDALESLWSGLEPLGG